MIDNAAEVFALQIPDPTGGSSCYWSPQNDETSLIMAALNSGQTTFPTETSSVNGQPIPRDPRCFSLVTSPAASSTQIVIEPGPPSGMPINTLSGYQNSPAFLFERERSPSAPAVVQIP